MFVGVWFMPFWSPLGPLDLQDIKIMLHLIFRQKLIRVIRRFQVIDLNQELESSLDNKIYSFLQDMVIENFSQSLFILLEFIA